MFGLASGIYQSYFAPPKLSILIIGLDGSGKTSLLERVKVTDIQTKLDIDSSSSLPASYAKGGAVAGVATASIEIEIRENGNQRGGGKRHEGGKPARLPPPLPPKQASKSRQQVEKMSKEGFSSSAVDGGGDGAAAEASHALDSLPPPPLVAVSDGNSSTASEDGSAARIQPAGSKTNKSAKPPLPPQRSAKAPTITPTTKKSSFIELLRCPSPKKYSDAALVDDEDEEYHAGNSSSVRKDALVPWSTEYLADYYINYQEGEEFDVKQTKAGGGGGGGAPRKMFPLDRIRPTLGQNLAKLDLCGCKCSLFDLSGAVSVTNFLHWCIRIYLLIEERTCSTFYAPPFLSRKK